MNKDESINAIPGPSAPVLPPEAASTSVTPVVGVVMLDTQFPRPPGDVGNVASWNVPVNFQVVRGIWPDKVVQSAKGLRAGRVVPAFVAIVQGLEKKGVSVITTSCGFLVLLQKELQAAVRVPVVTSSLLQLPGLLRQQRQVGVLTIHAGALGAEHIRSAGVPRDRVADVLVQGVDRQGEFASAILGNHAQMDLARAEADVVAAALALQARAPQLRTVVLECTNMPPYAAAIRAATGWQVLGLLDSRVLAAHAATASAPKVEVA